MLRQGAHLVQAVDHRTEDGRVGAQELGVLLPEVPRLGRVHLEQAKGRPTWDANWHVDHANTPAFFRNSGTSKRASLLMSCVMTGLPR